MISIVLATYNGARYIREQIDSVLAQTIQDFELVVCDDGSTDDTVSILRDYALKDKRIHVYVNDHNLGFKKNFENAISKSIGDYVALCDQDDIWLPDHLEIIFTIVLAIIFNIAYSIHKNRLLEGNSVGEKEVNKSSLVVS